MVTIRLDELGRVALPLEMRKKLGIDRADFVDVTVVDEGLLIQKHEPCCQMCGKKGELIDFYNRMLCACCFWKLTDQTKESTQD